MKLDNYWPIPVASITQNLREASQPTLKLIREIDKRTALLAAAVFGIVVLSCKVISNWRLRQPNATDIARWMRLDNPKKLLEGKIVTIPSGPIAIPTFILPLLNNSKLGWRIQFDNELLKVDGPNAWNLICKNLERSGTSEALIAQVAAKFIQILSPDTWKEFWKLHDLPRSVSIFDQDVIIVIEKNKATIRSEIDLSKSIKGYELIITRVVTISPPINSVDGKGQLTMEYSFNSKTII